MLNLQWSLFFLLSSFFIQQSFINFLCAQIFFFCMHCLIILLGLQVPAKHLLPVPRPDPEVVAMLTSGLTASIALEKVNSFWVSRVIFILELSKKMLLFSSIYGMIWQLNCSVHHTITKTSTTVYTLVCSMTCILFKLILCFELHMQQKSYCSGPTFFIQTNVNSIMSLISRSPNVLSWFVISRQLSRRLGQPYDPPMVHLIKLYEFLGFWT